MRSRPPLLDAINIAWLKITTDGLLTQRGLANHLIEREAHCHFTVKFNQPKRQEDIRLLFEPRAQPGRTDLSATAHGHIETHRIR